MVEVKPCRLKENSPVMSDTHYKTNPDSNNDTNLMFEEDRRRDNVMD